MNGSLQHQNSTTAFQRNYKSCMWDWLRIFDLHHRVTVRKLLEDSNHGGGLAGRAEIPGYYYAPPRASERGDLDGESNFQTLHKGNQTKRSGKAFVSSLILKKLFRKHHHRQQSATPRSTRTYPFHRAECSDYVLPVELTSKFDFVSAENSDSSINNGQLQQLHRIRKCGTMESVNLLCQTDVEHFTQNKAKLAHNGLSKKEESVEEMGRNAEFQCHDDLFSEMIEDSDLALENLFRDFGKSSSKRLLGKTGSLKSVDLLDKRQINNSPNLLQISFKHSTQDAPRSEAAATDDHIACYNSEFLSRSSLQFTKQVTHGTLLSHSSNVKKKMKTAIAEDSKEHLHISMDGLLHKIPYGQKISGDVMKEKLFRSASARSHGESIGDNVSIPPKVHPSLRFRRSHSLTEYPTVSSHVLESSSTREFTSLPENLMSTKVDLGLPDTTASTLRSFPFQEVTNEPLDETMLIKAAAPNYIVNKNEAVELPSPAEPTTGDKLVNVKASVQPDVCKKQILDVRTDGTIEGETQLPLVMNGLTENGTCIISGTCKENTDCNLLPTHELVDQQESHVEHRQSEVLEVSDSSQIQGSHVVDAHELQVDSSDESVKPSPTSVLELEFGSDIFRPAEYKLPEADSDIDSTCFNVEKPDILVKTISDDMDGRKYSSHKKKARAFAAVDNNRSHLDQKDEEGFNYVRSVLRKSGFNGFEFLVDPVLSEKCDPFDDLEVASYYSNDASPDHQMLSDLISEILLELSERFSISSWFSCFDLRMRTMPIECNVLEEVWKKASMLLSSQSLPAHMYECPVARDIAKDDRWLYLQLDAVTLGMELESLVVDDLLEELAFEHLEDL